MPKTRHVVLADRPATAKLLGQLDRALKRVAKETGISFGDPESEESGDVTARRYADVSGKHHGLAFVEDKKSGRRVEVTGRRAAAIADILADALPAEPPEQLVEQATTTRDRRAVLRAGLVHSDAGEGVVVTALRSTDPEQIDAGIAAAALAGAERFAGDLHRLAAEAPDSPLRLRAEAALQGADEG